MSRKDGEIEDWEDFETIDEARNEVKRLRELLKRCEPHLLVPFAGDPSDFWELIKEIEREVGR